MQQTCMIFKEENTSSWLTITQGGLTSRNLSDESSHSVIKALKEVFATHGIPDVIMSDYGPQNSTEAFRQFAEAYHFTHVTSSPKYPQANGEVERAIPTAKSMLRKSEDIFRK